MQKCIFEFCKQFSLVNILTLTFVFMEEKAGPAQASRIASVHLGIDCTCHYKCIKESMLDGTF